MEDCNIWPQFFTPPCVHALCHVMCGANLPWVGWPALPPDCGLSPERHALVSRHNASTRSSGTEAGSPEPALTAGQGGTSGAEPSHPVTSPPVTSPHSTASQPPDTWVYSPMISRTSVTPDTWAINSHYSVPLMFFNCYVTKVIDTLYIKTWIGFHPFISYSIITTDKWGKPGPQKWPNINKK